MERFGTWEERSAATKRDFNLEAKGRGRAVLRFDIRLCLAVRATRDPALRSRLARLSPNACYARIRRQEGKSTMSRMHTWHGWFGWVLLAGGVYSIIGVSFAPLATPSEFSGVWRPGRQRDCIRGSYWLRALQAPQFASFSCVACRARNRCRSLRACGRGQCSFVAHRNRQRAPAAHSAAGLAITTIPAFVVALGVCSLLVRLPRYRSGMPDARSESLGGI